MDLKEIVEYLKQGLKDELECLKNVKPIKLINLRRSGAHFACVSQTKLQGEGLCTLNRQEYTVSMQSNNGVVLIGGLEEIEDDFLREIYISQDQSSLIKAILNEFEGFKPNKLHEALFDTSPLKEGEKVFIEHLNDAQNDSISKSLANDCVIVVGPAGTGKTKTIAETIKELLSLKKRILVCSHANLAVEGALEEMLKTQTFDSGELIVSINTDSSVLKDYSIEKVSAEKAAFLKDELGELEEILKELLKNRAEHQALLGPAENALYGSDILLANKNREIIQEEQILLTLEKETSLLEQRVVKLEKNKLLATLSSGKKKEELISKLQESQKTIANQNRKIKTLQWNLDKFTKNIDDLKSDYQKKRILFLKEEEKITLVKTRINEIKEEMNAVAGEDLFSPAIIAGSTLMSAAINKRIHEAKFDVLLVDETSMANVPTLFLAMQHIKEKVILFGDPMQLPPVAKTEILKTSIYDFTGVKESFTEGVVYPRSVLIDTQYRCHPIIAALNSKLFYGGLLKNGRVIDSDKKPMYIKNTHGYGSSFKSENGSFINEVHQKIVLEYVRNALKRGQRSIGVISPYRAQANAIQTRFELELLEEYPDVDFKAATIHSFQGQEKDVIIFDMTFGRSYSGRNNLPKMLVGDIHSSAACLLNVAGSRARDFLVLVCDLQFTEEKVATLPNYENMILGMWLKEIKEIVFKQSNNMNEENVA